MMIKSLFAAAALAGLALSSTATAAADAKDRPVANAPAPDAASSTTTAIKDEHQYCVMDTVTGTRLQKKVCKTRSQWQKEGFDPLNP